VVHTHKQPFYSSVDFVRANPGEPVSEETFTHSHSSWSSVILHLLQFMASSLFNPCALQSFSTISLQVFFGLPLGPPLHTPYISSPNHYLLFATHAHTIATCFVEVLKLCLVQIKLVHNILHYFYIIIFYNRSFLHVCTLQGHSLFSNLDHCSRFQRLCHCNWGWLAICRPSTCTGASGVVSVGVCNRSMRTSKCTCLIFSVSIGLDPG